MRTKAFTKEIRRSITRSMSRFWAIFIIVALGAGFYASLRSIAPDMRLTIDHYFDEQHVMDLHGISTMGFTDGDIEALESLEEIDQVMPAYTVDVNSKIDQKDTVIRVHSLAEDFQDEDSMNRPILTDGRWPEKGGECVISTNTMYSTEELLGKTITVTNPDQDLNEVLNHTEFQVVGIVESPYYISFSLGSSDIGSGTLDQFMYVLSDDFNQPAYTEIFMTVNGAAELSAFTEEYDDLVEQAANKVEELAKERTLIRLEEIKQEAQQTLDQQKAEFNQTKQDTEAQLAQARQQLESGDQELQTQKDNLESAKKQIDDHSDQLYQGQMEYIDGVFQFYDTKDEVYRQLDDAQAELDRSESELNSHSTEIAVARGSIDVLTKVKEEIQKQIDQANQTGNTELAAQLQQTADSLENKIAELQTQVDQYDQATAQIEQGKQLLAKQRADADAQFSGAKQELQTSKDQLSSANSQLDQAKQLYESGAGQIESAEAELTSGWEEYNANAEKAQSEFQAAQAKLDEAQRQIDSIVEPEWYVLDRHTNVGFASFEGDADRFDSLSKVFPIIFFLVAALVALTTMTRMVEEERVVIGTYKALGYSNLKIMSKYLIYAALATVLGSVVGIIVCSKVLPVVCWNSYRILYTAPGIIAPISLKFSLIGGFAAALCTLGATFFACRSSLSETPASLMLPKAPKAGKRILLERITPIWSHLSFSHKVTARNLFRYKKRLFMTVIGIAGCTALLLTGFGVKDSVSGVIDNQYGKIYHYDMTISLKDEVGQETREKLQDAEYFSTYLPIYSKAMELTENNTTLNVNLLIPEQTDKLTDMVTLQTRLGKKEVEFNQDSVVITEKMSKLFDLGVGDKIHLENSQNQQKEFTITGVTENYVSHYIYIAPELYEDTMGELPANNQVLAICASDDEQEHEKISEDLLQQPDISTVQFLDNISQQFAKTIQSLDYVILVLIICAGLLAFVVLYNLTNINITERQRELATIKVLGFYDREVSAYVYRETTLLTILGVAVGLVFGVFLHLFVIQTVEVDMVMFGRTVHFMSYIYSILLTILFSILVNLVMSRKLKKISMVESLKSVD
ncbi:FtsX-like permease family protein [Massilioclostridium coli]|uniref:FtsX-like permease family protein n=1 Tax=Massilioclostridium coli TaxID=1870991 RepID=UPI0022E1CD66|nr:FtsX-like permease family protein [Massilioclostridium coli]